MRRLRKQTLDGNVETLLLAILQAGPSYGYAIVKELNERSEGILQLGEGTIYHVLHRLEEKKLAGLCDGWVCVTQAIQYMPTSPQMIAHARGIYDSAPMEILAWAKSIGYKFAGGYEYD